MTTLDFTHQPGRLSFVETANLPQSDFPIQNLPFGVFRRKGERETAARGGVAIGDSIVDLKLLCDMQVLRDKALEAAKAAALPSLNQFMAMGPAASRCLRHALSKALSNESAPEIRRDFARALIPMSDSVMLNPARIGAFTDFFTSAHHATRAGRISRPDQPLPAAFRHMPMGYNGRASAVQVAGELARPWGMKQSGAGEPYRFGPTEALDFELEVGAYIGRGTQGAMLELNQARDHLFGICLLNDWSARDMQRAESFPLGPFLSKSAATSISPWVITADALAPFRTPGNGDFNLEDAPMHLRPDSYMRDGALSVELTMSISTERMRAEGREEQVLTRTNSRHLYWTFEQMLAHQSTVGCPLEPGDLMGSGTVSGPDRTAAACLYELCIAPHARRFEALELANGEKRQWLQDGDEVVLRGWAERPGARRIGLGECRTLIRPARSYPTATFNLGE